jgi:hypothetical protein
MTFRDAYRRVAEQLKDGTFVPDPTPPLAGLELEAGAAALAASTAWTEGRRDMIQRTTEQLFAWSL